VERWFRELTDKRIRRGSFYSVDELIAAIEDPYFADHQQAEICDDALCQCVVIEGIARNVQAEILPLNPLPFEKLK
jgi:hypothetical protein